MSLFCQRVTDKGKKCFSLSPVEPRILQGRLAKPEPDEQVQQTQALQVRLVSPRKSYGRGRLSTVDHLVPTSVDQLLFIL